MTMRFASASSEVGAAAPRSKEESASRSADNEAARSMVSSEVGWLRFGMKLERKEAEQRASRCLCVLSITEPMTIASNKPNCSTQLGLLPSRSLGDVVKRSAQQVMSFDILIQSETTGEEF